MRILAAKGPDWDSSSACEGTSILCAREPAHEVSRTREALRCQHRVQSTAWKSSSLSTSASAWTLSALRDCSLLLTTERARGIVLGLASRKKPVICPPCLFNPAGLRLRPACVACDVGFEAAPSERTTSRALECKCGPFPARFSPCRLPAQSSRSRRSSSRRTPVAEALRTSKRDSAAGLSGATVELYKLLRCAGAGVLHFRCQCRRAANLAMLLLAAVELDPRATVVIPPFACGGRTQDECTRSRRLRASSRATPSRRGFTRLASTFGGF